MSDIVIPPVTLYPSDTPVQEEKSVEQQELLKIKELIPSKEMLTERGVENILKAMYMIGNYIKSNYNPFKNQKFTFDVAAVLYRENLSEAFLIALREQLLEFKGSWEIEASPVFKRVTTYPPIGFYPKKREWLCFSFIVTIS